MRRFVFIVAIFVSVFLFAGGLAKAAPSLSSLPPEGSSVQIGQTMDYSWSSVSTRDNCIAFYPPGSSGWSNWTCLGSRIGSYSKNTSDLNIGNLSAQVATKRCSFFGWVCSWDYSNIVSHNLIAAAAPPPEPQPSNCIGSGSNRRCLDLIPLGATVSGGSSASTFAKLSWSKAVSAGRTVSFDALPPSGITVAWPNGQTCAIPAGQLSCGLNVTFNTMAVSSTVTYAVPIEADQGPSQNFELTVEPSKNKSPSVAPLAPQPPADYCVSPLTWTLKWDFSDPDPDSFQSAYQIKIFEAATNHNVLSRLYYSSSQSFAVPAGTLNFNKTYAWRVKVWDEKYATAEADGENFATIQHRPPKVDFYWKPYPRRPSAGERIDFYDDTDFFDAAPSKRQWRWTLPAGMVSLSPTDTYNISTKAEGMGNYAVVLNVTDSEGLSCSAAKAIPIGRGVPIIKEVAPH